MKKLLLSVPLFVLLWCFNIEASSAEGGSSDASNFAAQCTDCHQSQVHNWQLSDHAKAMMAATPENVLANFDGELVEHYGQQARFYQKDGKFWVDIGYNALVDTYVIDYTFGHYPLQQYLVDTGKGKVQLLPFAWDSRPLADGGQRWYHNYSEEEITPDDRLHWRQPLQNWNGMCADCHSDGLKRNYHVEQDVFATTSTYLNVGCLSCHGDQSEHLAAVNQAGTAAVQVKGLLKSFSGWRMAVGDRSASWQGEKRDNRFMDKCFSCHALRSPLSDGIDSSKEFLDQFSPQLLNPPLYYADGQIRDEVYVYGSFLQSKMHQAGVNCLDCHDAHSMKLKFDSNTLCLQCHNIDIYQQKDHHGHQPDSEGSQCVSCHMPDNRYMGVDDRRDHSFKIPRPAISAQYGTPNACLDCHQDKDDDWSLEQVSQWHGQSAPLTEAGLNYVRLQSGEALKLEQHLHIVADHNLPEIIRATALGQLPQTTQIMSAEILSRYTGHDSGLIRLAAANAAVLVPPGERVPLIAPLLSDSLKAVRVAAANALVGITLSGDAQKAFNGALRELILSNELSSWRGEGHANQAVVAIQQQDWPVAAAHFQQAIKVDPYFEQGYTNLAEIYRVLQQATNEAKVYQQALDKVPNAASVHYAHGLYLVRSNRHSESLASFNRAFELAPNVDQYLYAYALSLDSQQNSQEALELLLAHQKNFANSALIRELGVYLAQKLNNREAYDLFVN